MEDNHSTPNTGLKTVQIIEGQNTYKCQIQTIQDFLQVSLFIGDNLKQEGNIHITKIQNQILTYGYNINEIFEEINALNQESFSIIKEANKDKIKIEFIILRKKKYLYIDLIKEENININNNDLIKTITELKEIIKSKDEKIKSLEEKLNQYNISTNDNNYNNFDIKLKEPLHQVKYHTSGIRCATVLNDGRFATGSSDNSIIIYNNKTFKPDLTIKEHSDYVRSLIQLSSGILCSGSGDKTIKLYNINGNTYNVLQTLSYHTDTVTKIIELRNKKLVSCSYDNTIIFYFKDNNQYTKDFNIKTNGYNGPIIQTKNNEICYYEDTNSALCFFDLQERKNITKINNISVTYYICDSLLMMSNDLLLAAGENKLTIININSHSIIRSIDVSGSSSICSACLLTDDIILTADCNHRIIQWRIQHDNLELISKKENAHDSSIFVLKKIGNGLIMSGDHNGEVKIW